MAVMELTRNKKDIIVSLGGVVEDQSVSERLLLIIFRYQGNSFFFNFVTAEIHRDGVRGRQAELAEPGHVRLLPRGPVHPAQPLPRREQGNRLFIHK